ncbi:hypothetical protein [Streptomyces sp. BBFR102]|uniref:hypothetical protein n=1 Tax=Streptomyces sp. BBFR102 TaxID=3448171 RepID=UPI003F536789
MPRSTWRSATWRTGAVASIEPPPIRQERGWVHLGFDGALPVLAHASAITTLAC